ncbi:MAG: ATP-binding protein [Alphaproteobacteria bacterium]|jgi:signal transduction histidine kinase
MSNPITRLPIDLPLRVLAVDDDRTYGQILMAMLQSILPETSVIEHVNSGAQAMLKLHEENQHYDCILLDLNLPDSRGLNIAQECFKNFPDLAVLMLTAESDPETAMRSLQAGAEDYLIKGEFTQAGLARAIRYATQRKAAQRDQRMLSKALADQRALNELQSDFIRLVSHEFRTPLGIISTSMQLLEHRIPQEMKSQGMRQFEKVREAVKRLTRLMDNVLLLNQMQDGKLHFQPIAFDFAQLFDRVVAEFRRNMGEHRVCVEGGSLPEHFFGDQYLMEVILINVLSNAFKYSPPDKPVNLTVVADAEKIVIRARDEGVGMSPSALSRVGEKFYRSEKVSHIEGTGLGVYLTRRLVEYHQGTLSFTSVENQGTTVDICFPILAFDRMPSAA